MCLFLGQLILFPIATDRPDVGCSYKQLTLLLHMVSWKITHFLALRQIIKVFNLSCNSISDFPCVKFPPSMKRWKKWSKNDNPVADPSSDPSSYTVYIDSLVLNVFFNYIYTIWLMSILHLLLVTSCMLYV